MATNKPMSFRNAVLLLLACVLCAALSMKYFQSSSSTTGM